MTLTVEWIIYEFPNQKQNKTSICHELLKVNSRSEFETLYLLGIIKAEIKVLTGSVLAVGFPLVSLHVLKLKLAGSLSGPDLLLRNSSSSMPAILCSF